jgi:N-acetylglutamate synthase-like GNAT family acetyltransferase
MSAPKSSVTVRLATGDDAENITALINLAFGIAEAFFIEEARVTLEGVIEYLNSGEFLLAEKHDKLVGCVYLEPRGDRTYLGLLSVDPNLQKSGIGSLLMTEAEERWRAQDAKYMDILTVNLREDLPSFYRKRGYIETGTSPFPVDIETKLPCHFVHMSKRLDG